MGSIISFSSTGNFSKTQKFLSVIRQGSLFRTMDSAGRQGVNALRSATPERTGKAAAAWSYKVVNTPGKHSIYWTNSDVDSEGTPIVVLLQYGHGTGTGGYVQGHDFINGAIKPIMDRIAEDVWKAVTSA